MSGRTVHIPVTREVRCERVGTLYHDAFGEGVDFCPGVNIARGRWLFVLAPTEWLPLRRGFGVCEDGKVDTGDIATAADGDTVYLVHDEEP